MKKISLMIAMAIGSMSYISAQSEHKLITAFDAERLIADSHPQPAEPSSLITVDRLKKLTYKSITNMTTTIDTAITNYNTYGYNNMNGSICGQYNIFDSLYNYSDGIALSSKAAQVVNAQGNVISYTERKISDGFLFNNKQSTYQADGITPVAYKSLYIYGPSDSSLIRKKYNAAGLITKDTFIQWVPSYGANFDFSMFYTHVYDANNRITSINYVSKSNQPYTTNYMHTVRNTKRYYVSPTDDKIAFDSISIKRYDADGTLNSSQYLRATYEYNASGKVTSITYYDYVIPSYEYKYTYEYDSYGNRTFYGYWDLATMSGDEPIWTEIQTQYSFYNSDNQLDSLANYQGLYPPGSVGSYYVNSWSEKYKYNTAGNLKTYIYTKYILDLDNDETLNAPSSGSVREYEYETVEVPTSITDATSIAKIYPNPTASNINIDIPLDLYSEGYTMHIMDVTGRILSSHALERKNTQLSIASLPTGVYIAKILNADGSIAQSTKIMKQ